MEHYTSFTIKDVKFVDLCQFMLSSLDKLSNNLNKDQFRETRKYLESLYVQQPNQPQDNNVTEGGEVGEAMFVNEDYQKHTYQSTTTNWRRPGVDDTKRSVPIWIYRLLWTIPRTTDGFYSLLTEEDISEVNYTHTQRVFKHFDMTNLRDNHNFYLLTDELLLVDVFENFRDGRLQHVLILPIISFLLVCPGKVLLKWQAWNWTFSLILISTCSSRKRSGEG